MPAKRTKTSMWHGVRRLRCWGRHRDAIAAIAGLLSPFAVAVALASNRDTLPNRHAALLLVAVVAVVVAVGANGNRRAGLLASVSAAAWFDFFLASPYQRFAISGAADLVTTGLLVTVGVAVTEIAVRSRRQHIVAVAEEAYLDRIGGCIELLGTGAGAVEVVARVNRLVVSLLGARGSRFATGPGPVPPAPEVEQDGRIRWGDSYWDVDRFGLPNEELLLIARWGDRVYGRFVLQPVVGSAPTRDARRAATVLAQIAGAALAGRGRESTTALGSYRTSIGRTPADLMSPRTGLRMAAPRHP
jgi:hypothetical protein